MGLLRAQADEVVDELFVVVLVTAVAAVQVSRVDPLAQLAVGRIGQEGDHARLLQREDPLVSLAQFAGLLAGLLLHAGRQPGHLFGLELHREVVVLGQQVVAELHRSEGQFAVDLRQPGLLVGTEQRSGAHERTVGLLQQAALLGVEVERRPVIVDRLHPLEERVVEQDLVVVGRQPGHRLLLQGLHLGRVLRGTEHAEDQRGLRKHLPRVVERQDDVLEGRLVAVGHDSVDLGIVQRHAALDGREEMFG